MLKSGVVIAASTVLAGLITCHTADPPPATITRKPRPTPAVTLVLASADMSPHCRMVTAHAVRHLVELGAKIEMITVDETHPSFGLEPHVGQVVVRAGLPLGGLSESFAWRSPAGTVLRAEIVLGYCSTALVAHDLSHVLGMEMSVNYELLLHAEGQDWGLEPMGRP
jgi:hypothetical protein